MIMNKIETQGAPQPGGHYSQAIAANNIVFVSGQLPVNPETGARTPESIEEQTLQVLKNIEAIVNAAGSGVSKITKMTLFITDISLWDAVNKTYSEFFAEHRPARSIVPVKDLHHGFMIEADAIAVI